MKLSRADKLRILELGRCKLGTDKWRTYAALSAKGLATIHDTGKAWGAMFGVSTRDVELTEAGRELYVTLLEETDLWSSTAVSHRPILALARPTRCFCWACVAEFTWHAFHTEGVAGE